MALILSVLFTASRCLLSEQLSSHSTQQRNGFYSTFAHSPNAIRCVLSREGLLFPRRPRPGREGSLIHH